MRNFWGFLILLFLIAAVLRVDFFFYVIYIFGMLAILTQWWTRHAVRSIRGERAYQNRAFYGEQVPVRLTVCNTSLLPIPYVRLHESLPIALISPPFARRVVSLWPRETTTLDYTLDCRRRGVYRLGPLTANAGDVFGFGEQEANEAPASAITIYPKIVPLGRLGLPTRSPFVSLRHRQRLFEDPARVRGVRPYQVGDSPRHIHWTASAATGDLLVKQYEPAIALETMVLLNLDEAAYDPRWNYFASETGVTVAASILYHLQGLDQAGGLAVNGRDSLTQAAPAALPPSHGQAHLMQALDVLARAETSPALPFADWVRAVTGSLGWGATVALVTPVEPPDLAPLLLHLKRAGFSPTLILTHGPDSGTAAQLGVPSAIITYETEVPELARLDGAQAR